MPDRDKDYPEPSRILSGETIEERDRAGIAVAKSNILEITREHKGLPNDPPQLDVDAISQLKDAKIVDAGEVVPLLDPNRLTVDVSKLGHPERLSAFPLSHRLRRMRKLKNRI